MPTGHRELYEFLRGEPLAVEASVSAVEAPQAAVVGIVVSERFEVFFDTLASSRKMANLRRDPRIAFVLGGSVPGDERTVQYEGVADEPTGADLERLKALYFARYPDGRERELQSDIAYVRARPTWIRYSDFGRVPPEIVEFSGPTLPAPA